MDKETAILIDSFLNIILKSLSAIEQVTGKTREEVLELLKDESAKTDELLKQLK